MYVESRDARSAFTLLACLDVRFVGESRLRWPSVLLLARLAQVQRVRTSQGDGEAQRLQLGSCKTRPRRSWHPVTTLHPPNAPAMAAAARGHITACEPLPGATTPPTHHVCVEVKEDKNKQMKKRSDLFQSNF